MFSATESKFAFVSICPTSRSDNFLSANFAI
uniref:Uncharacterized protein n=1 Tax=Siphoviridae sp. ctgN495 TaxID=2825608 RepID=A0A8S5UCU5_9CAUD|nr:MAG TPA: hypothetical protein [Siphoviridae sp. ctgN495]